MVAGSRGDDDHGSQAGAAYVFTLAGDELVFAQKLFASDGSAQSLYSGAFGRAVAIDGGMIVVGANEDDRGRYSGSAFVFTYNNGLWSERAELVPQPNGLYYGYYGSALAIDEETILVGAPSAGNEIGYAYIVTASCEIPCRVDMNKDGVLDFFDISAFLTAFGNRDSMADFTGDENFDFFDISAFLTAFGVGCP